MDKVGQPQLLRYLLVQLLMVVNSFCKHLVVEEGQPVQAQLLVLVVGVEVLEV
jgi:hypothetical protein